MPSACKPALSCTGHRAELCAATVAVRGHALRLQLVLGVKRHEQATAVWVAQRSTRIDEIKIEQTAVADAKSN